MPHHILHRLFSHAGPGRNRTRSMTILAFYRLSDDPSGALGSLWRNCELSSRLFLLSSRYRTYHHIYLSGSLDHQLTGSWGNRWQNNKLLQIVVQFLRPPTCLPRREIDRQFHLRPLLLRCHAQSSILATPSLPRRASPLISFTSFRTHIHRIATDREHASFNTMLVPFRSRIFRQSLLIDHIDSGFILRRRRLLGYKLELVRLLYLVL